MSECTHNCDSCSANCASKSVNIEKLKLGIGSAVKKIIGVVSLIIYLNMTMVN